MKVLVFFKERCRIVELQGGGDELLSTIRRLFHLPTSQEVVLQIQDEDWGEYVDLVDDQPIPDRSRIKVIASSSIATSTQQPQQVQSSNSSSSVQCGSESVQFKLSSGTGVMKVTPPPPLDSDESTSSTCTSLSLDEIVDKGTIYKKEGVRPLSKYQKAINKAAQTLCVNDPGLLSNRPLLIERARERIVSEGFQFAKGKSRSKKLASGEPKPKRVKVNKDVRSERLREIEEDVKDVNERMSFKEKLIEKYLNHANYIRCDEVKEEVIVLKKKLRELSREKKQLSEANRKSTWYYSKKEKQASSLSSSASPEGPSSLPLFDSPNDDPPLYDSLPPCTQCHPLLMHDPDELSSPLTHLHDRPHTEEPLTDSDSVIGDSQLGLTYVADESEELTSPQPLTQKPAAHPEASHSLRSHFALSGLTQKPLAQKLLTLTQQPLTQQPLTQQPLTQEPLTLTQQLLTQQPLTQEPLTLTQQPLTQEPLTQQPLTQQPLTQEPLTQQPLTQEPLTLTQQPLTEEPLTLTQQPLTQQLLTQEPLTQQPLTQEPLTQQPLTQEPLTQEPLTLTQQPLTQQPLTQQLLTQEPLTLTQQPLNQEPLTQEPLTQQPLTQEPETFNDDFVSNLVDIYVNNKEKCLSEYLTVSSSIYSSKMEGLSLQEYCIAVQHYCMVKKHTSCNCSEMTMAARIVMDSGIHSMKDVFVRVFPKVIYRPGNAKRRLLQMPLVALHIRKELYLMEKITGFNYSSLVMFLEEKMQTKTDPNITKEEIKKLFSITSSERERELVRYAVCKASGYSQSKARHHFGFESMTYRMLAVQDSIKGAQDIHSAYDSLAECQDKALVECYGFSESCLDVCEGFNDSDSSDNTCSEIEIEDFNDTCVNIDGSTLLQILRASKYNWFEFVDQVEFSYPDYNDFNSFFLNLANYELGPECMHLVVQSYQAYVAASNDLHEEDRICRSINGEVVSGSESSNDESMDKLETLKKKRLKLKRQVRRLKSKAIAQCRFLSRKIAKKTSKILIECPDIGNVIEQYVKDHSVGADAWRRTGVLTFDGNAKIKEKVTYDKIRLHLQKHYGRHFSYGSVVELCVPRNKRRRSAKRYKGVAKITTRRARKGFNLRYNPDAHWSASFYKGLNEIQYCDGGNILNINRDDATGFRLDTLTTCKQYRTPTFQGSEVLTTRTDYVNKYPSTLQTTSYNFTGTNTTPEVCVGVVKASPLHPKTPAQHISDLMMLSKIEQLQPVFTNLSTNLSKEVDCIRVDGAADEGPSHETIQYWWTYWHVTQHKVATLVTTRCSGSSYLNRVELQNGCLSLGHANTFIPSTLAGSCNDPDTGSISESRLQENLELAITAYISRVNGCPCGDSKIDLYRGSSSEPFQNVSNSLEVFLKGSKKKKEDLHHKEPELYEGFKKIWDIRNDHMVSGLPESYVCFLKCCYKPNCRHPICVSQIRKELTWFPGGPSINSFLFRSQTQ